MPSKVLKQLYFSQSPLRQNLFAEDVGNFLDGYPLASLIVRSRAEAIPR